MPLMSSPENRTLVSVDMERYSAQNNVDQYQSQQIFRQVMREAVEAAGLDRDSWTTQPGGDGEFAVLPAGTPESTIISELAPKLDRLLREHNRRLARHVKVRLRLAVHSGPVHMDGANGVPGDAVVTVCRLVDSPPVKDALVDFPEASVALIVSERIYEDVVRHHYEGIRPENFRRVNAKMPAKGFSATAWLHVLGEDVHTVVRGEGPPAQNTPRKSPGVAADTGRNQSSQTGAAASRGCGSEEERSGSQVYKLEGNTLHGPTAIGPGGVAGDSFVINRHDDL